MRRKRKEQGRKNERKRRDGRGRNIINHSRDFYYGNVGGYSEWDQKKKNKKIVVLRHSPVAAATRLLLSVH